MTVRPGTAATGAAGADALKLTSYFGERQREAAGRFTADALLDLYGQHSLAASVLLRGAEGFGVKQRLRTDVSLTLSEDLPLIAVAVDRRERIEEVAGPTARLLRSGLVTLERAQLLSGDLSGARLPGEDAVAGADGAAYDETKLTVYLGRQERVYRMPAYMAVCDLLHRRGAAGATALLGVDGTVRGARERASFFSRNAATPMMVIAVGQGTLFGRVLPELGGLLRQPLLTVEQVRICKRDGKLLCGPSALPGADPSGMPLWHKLMVYTSESALHDGQPVHREIVRRLRAAGLAGATTQRGIWGFHGDHAPHGDRLLQAGRRVPVVTIVIDAPERIAAAFDVIDPLTAEQGLVTSETVPAVRLAGGTGLPGVFPYGA